MIAIGKHASLEVIKETDFGVYLDGGPFGEILLPNYAVPKGTKKGEELSVFIYCDSEDRIIATTLEPKAIVGDFAFLSVKAVGEYGAFLDWGLSKDLFVPFREQLVRMQKGASYLVYVYLDEQTDRIVASSRLNRFVKMTSEGINADEEVDLIVAQQTDLGYKVIVNETYWGMLFRNEVFRKIQIGDRIKGFVKQVREDKKLDIVLQKQGYTNEVENTTTSLLQAITQNDGFLPLTDKSPPQDIYAQLQMSKKAFKRAVGALYKQKKIAIEKKGIRLK